MSMEMALFAAAAMVVAAILTRWQPLLLAGGIAYGGVMLWAVHVRFDLMVPAMLGAVCLEIFGLHRMLRRRRDDAVAETSVTPSDNSVRRVHSKMPSTSGS